MLSTTSNIGKDIRTFLLKLLIMLVGIALIWNIPPTGALTEVGVHTLACFFGVVYGLCLMKEYGIYNLLIIILMGFSGAYADMGSAFIAAFGNSMFVQMFAIMLFVGIISSSGLARVIALKMINAKFAAGRPWTLTIVILVTASVLSLFMPCLVVIVVLSELIIEIYKGLNLKGSRWTMFILADVALLSIMGQDIMPFQLGPILYFGLLSSYDASYALSNFTGTYILLHLVFQVLTLLFCWGLTWLTCRGCVSELVNYKPSKEKFLFNEEQKIAFGILCGFIFFQLFPLFLPSGSSLRVILERPSLVGYATLASIVAMCLFKKNGKHFISFEQIAHSGIDWYMLLMLMSLGACVAPMTSEVTGIIQWINDLLTPIFSNFSMYQAFCLLAVITLVATNLTDDVAVMYVLMPVLYIVCQATGLNAGATLSVIGVCISVGILLPSATPYIALVFAKEDTGYIQKGKMIFWMIPRLVFLLAMLLSIGWLSFSWFPEM